MAISTSQQKVNRKRYGENYERIFGGHGRDRQPAAAQASEDVNAQIINAVRSIRPEYNNLIAQDRGLIGADLVLDMIDAALKYDDKP